MEVNAIVHVQSKPIYLRTQQPVQIAMRVALTVKEIQLQTVSVVCSSFSLRMESAYLFVELDSTMMVVVRHVM